MRCGKKKVWLDPNEINEIANTNSRKYTFFSSCTYALQITGIYAIIKFCTLPPTKQRSYLILEEKLLGRDLQSHIIVNTVTLRNAVKMAHSVEHMYRFD